MNIVNETLLAKKLDISVHKLRKDRSEKRGFKVYKIGSLVKYDLDKVMQFLEDSSADRK